jgi:hypothetical protein
MTTTAVSQDRSDSHSKRVIGAWGVLMALTAATWWVGTEHDVAGLGREFSTVCVLVLSFAKIYVIGNTFMELRESARWLNLAFTSWCIGVCLTLIVMYLTLV